jgi:hypothetical protein
MPLSIDSFNKLILVTSPTTEVAAQTLHDFVEDWVASPVGMVNDGTWDFRGEILNPQGKIEDPSNPGVFSQIILILNPEWQIQFWGGSGYTRVFGGKIVGGVGDEPILATGTAGDVTVLESPVDGVTVAAGSGLSAAQAIKLDEIYKRLGLDVSDAITDTASGIDSASGDIEITRTGDGTTTSTLTRQP